MKQLLLIFIGMLLLSACVDTVQQHSNAVLTGRALYQDLMANNAPYDSVLAQNLGSDDYGMKAYVMAFLKRGPNRNQDSTTAAQLQKAHMDNIGRMAKEGKLVLAGPFSDDGEIRGIYIFDVETIEEAQALTASDPAIQAGRLEMELHPWYGSAILPLIAPLNKRVEKVGWSD